MAFFDALRRMLRAEDAERDRDLQARLAEAWGLSDTSHPEFPRQVPAAEPTEMAAPPDPIAYDRDQWRRKLKRILDKLPDTEAEWNPMLAEGRALGLDEPWMLRAQIEEFALLVRRVIADREFTPQEHRKLELARQLIGMPEAEAEAMLKSIIAEAEAFFGESVKGA